MTPEQERISFTSNSWGNDNNYNGDNYNDNDDSDKDNGDKDNDKDHLESRDELSNGGTQLFHKINNFLVFQDLLAAQINLSFGDDDDGGDDDGIVNYDASVDDVDGKIDANDDVCLLRLVISEPVVNVGDNVNTDPWKKISHQNIQRL